MSYTLCPYGQANHGWDLSNREEGWLRTKELLVHELVNVPYSDVTHVH